MEHGSKPLKCVLNESIPLKHYIKLSKTYFINKITESYDLKDSTLKVFLINSQISSRYQTGFSDWWRCPTVIAPFFPDLCLFTLRSLCAPRTHVHTLKLTRSPTLVTSGYFRWHYAQSAFCLSAVNDFFFLQMNIHCFFNEKRSFLFKYFLNFH